MQLSEGETFSPLRRLHCRAAGLPAALVLVGLGALLAACAGTEPRIQRIVPSQNATAVATDTVIEISFDRSVDRASVESRVQVEPSLPGCRLTAGACRMDWAEETLRLPHDLLQPGTKYTVRLLAGFTDARGKPNRLDHSWSFVTEAPPSVTGLDPGPQSARVSPARDLVLTFSRAMQPQSVEAAVQLTPPTKVQVVQNPSNHAQFQIAPLRPLQPRTEYTVEVSLAARDAHGNGLAATLRSTFTTGDMSFPAMVSYLASTTDSGPRTTVGLVDPHPNPVAGRPLPKVLYQEPASGGTAALQDFWWLPEGRGLLLLRRLPSQDPGLFTYDLSSGALRDLGVKADAAALTPDGTRVAYTRGGELHLRTLADGQDRLLAREGSITGTPAFSPDGRTLVYVAVTEGPARVYLLNVSLGSRFRIPGVDDPTDQPAWAPDGDKLLFKRQRAGKASLWLFFVANAAGADLRRVADIDLEQPSWLDTTTVVGVLRQQGRPVVVRVNVFSATDGDGGRPLTRADTVSSGDQPSVPPYDRRVAFTSAVRGQSQIWVMNADGSAPLQLTYAEAGLTASRPKWTPRSP